MTISRDALENIGRTSSLVEDEGDFWFSRVLGEYWVAINKSDNGLNPHIRDGYWEPWIMTWVNNNVEPNWSVADLGANVGFYTFQLASIGCAVTAYEPNPAVFKLLKKSLAKNRLDSDINVVLHQKAVSNVVDELEFIVPRHHPMNGSLHSSVYSPDGEDKIKVKTVDNLKAFDFIKIDIEGGEIDVFDILSAKKHPLVLIEFRWDRYADPMKFANDIFDKYTNVSYVLHNGSEAKITSPEMLKQREHEDWMLVLRP